MKKFILIFISFFSYSFGGDLFLSCANTFDEAMSDTYRAPTSRVVMQSKAILVFPSVKNGGFIVGGSFGKGIMAQRNEQGWSFLPVDIGGGTIGFQVGFESGSLILFITNENIISKIRASELTLGADASITIGAFGRGKSTVNAIDKDIYTFSGSQGLYVGASIGGMSISVPQDRALVNNTQGYDKFLQILSKY